jgi:catechol 2,3-dioxygenase-like lactoylglutathione lyase family enzyme
MSNLELVALVVRDYDAAIHFFVDVLQFELVEDTPSLTNDGRPKRWVVVRPSGGQTGILLARADGDHPASIARGGDVTSRPAMRSAFLGRSAMNERA